MKKLVIFDLGETLVNYEGVSLNWSDNYLSAIQTSLNAQNINATESQFDLAISILNFYNTRVNSRCFEVAEGEVLSKVAKVFSAIENKFECDFFAYFQRKAVANTTALETLKMLKRAGLYTALLSDVPYGMPKELMLQDLGNLTEQLDVIFSSCEVGFRKPSPIGLKFIANYFDCSVEHAVYVGNEEKDIICAKSAGVESVLLALTNKNFGQTHTIRKLFELEPLLF